MKILVIRFRQMGDAILATSLLNTLRQSFADAEIHFVLNDRIAPLFEGHPSIDRIITFSDADRRSTRAYIRKVWHTVHAEHYDAIIDMRSTLNTSLFALFSRSSRYRIGVKKWYTRLAFNHFVTRCTAERSVVEHDALMAKPLEAEGTVNYTYDFTLYITEAERKAYREYLASTGIDLKRPILLANVTAKLAKKVWNEEKMTAVIRQFIANHPDTQIIFNYAPGQEEANARRIYEALGRPQQVFIDVKARSSRELVALSECITMFFGNEGGARHIAHAAGAPSLVICAPENSKASWIPQNSVPAEGIAPSDFLAVADLAKLPREKQYDVIEADYVIEKLEQAFAMN